MRRCLLVGFVVVLSVVSLNASPELNDQNLRTRLRSVVIKRLVFDNVTGEQAAGLLQAAIVKASTNPTPGVAIIYNPAFDGDTDNPTSRGKFPIPPDLQDRRLSFEPVNLTAEFILNKLVAELDMKYLLTGDTVIITDQNAPESRVRSLVYPAGIEQAAAFEKEGAFGTSTNGGVHEDALREYFATMGLTWPNGSSIRYFPVSRLFALSTTIENHSRFDYILRSHLAYRQVEIQLQYVAFENAAIEALTVTGRVTIASLQALRHDGKSRLIAAPQVVTVNGSEGHFKSVREYVYPTGFTANHSVPAGTTNGMKVVGMVVEPSSFETREVGSILTVIPEVNPEGTRVMLSLSPEWVDDPVWRNYGNEYQDSNGLVQTARMEQPLFFTHRANAQVELADGEMVLLGGGGSTPDGKSLVYLFVSAHILKDGQD